MPAMGTPCTASASDALPYASLDDRTSGSTLGGTPNSRSSSSSQSHVWMSNSIVRDALLTSVTCRMPLLTFDLSHVSTVPNASLTAPAHARAPGPSSRIHRLLRAEQDARLSRPDYASAPAG